MLLFVIYNVLQKFPRKKDMVIIGYYETYPFFRECNTINPMIIGYITLLNRKLTKESHHYFLQGKNKVRIFHYYPYTR